MSLCSSRLPATACGGMGLTRGPKRAACSQTAVALLYFYDMGLNHDDEMSLAVWSGTVLVGNIGYWSHGAAGRNQTEVWDGGGALHLVDESANSLHEERPRYHGRVDILSWLT